jgi:hypothetical protein
MKKTFSLTPTITNQTIRFISERPHVKDCLRLGLINYSSLARMICKAEKIKRYDGVLMACRRYSKMIKSSSALSYTQRKLLRDAKFRLRSKMMVAIVDKMSDYDRLSMLQQKVKSQRGDFNVIEGEEALTIITNDQYYSLIKETFKQKIKRTVLGLVQLTMLFDEKIETTPGVVVFIYSLLAEKGINVLEEMSCWTDLMLILEESDAAAAMQVLNIKGTLST